MSRKQWIINSGVAVVLLALGFSAGFLYDEARKEALDPAHNPQARGKLVRSGNYTYINPLLMCEIMGGGMEVEELQTTKHSVEELIEKKKRDGDIETASVYIRTLNSGRLATINPDEKFAPASMLKVAIMMSYLKIAESDPAILSRPLRYSGVFATDVVQYTEPPGREIQSGKTYTVAELLDDMILYSGNNSRHILREYLDTAYPHALSDIYADLGLPMPNDNQIDFMTAREYTRLFMVLYNATYLGNETSETALQALTKTKYVDGIVAGVQGATAVAHKFGERAIIAPDGRTTNQEFHDCGIVYYPQHPYLLCIMTKGNDFKKLQSTIADISRLVYSKINDLFIKDRP